METRIGHDRLPRIGVEIELRLRPEVDGDSPTLRLRVDARSETLASVRASHFRFPGSGIGCRGDMSRPTSTTKLRRNASPTNVDDGLSPVASEACSRWDLL